MLTYSLLGCSLVISIHPESKNVDLGEKEVIFKCKANGIQPEYSWKFNGHTMTDKTGNTLKVSNIRKRMAGRYQCCVKNRFECVTSNSAELRIGRYTSLITNVCQHSYIISNNFSAQRFKILGRMDHTGFAL